MKNPAPELERGRTGVPIKDKRALVLFLFGALMLIGDIAWKMQEKPLDRYALALAATPQQLRLIRLAPQAMAGEQMVVLEPMQPIPATVPAHYALFLQQPLPINRADNESLQLLPGVGPHLARAITTHIQHHGGLSRPEDLLQVAGIGPKTLERLLPFIRIDSQATQP